MKQATMEVLRRVAGRETGPASRPRPDTRRGAGAWGLLAVAVVGLTGSLGAREVGPDGVSPGLSPEGSPAAPGQQRLGLAEDAVGRFADRGGDRAPHRSTHGSDTARARVDLGVGAGRHGFRLSVEGGQPGGRALLVVRPEGGAATTQTVALDETGSGGVTRRDWPAERDCDAWFLLATKGSGGNQPTNQVTVPAAGPGGTALMQRGDVLVNEFLKDPKSVSDSSGEWIELWNATNRTVNIEGWWLLDDGGDQHMLRNQTQGIYLQPGQFFVLARKADPALNGGVTVDYVYNGYSLSNGSDEIRLVSRGGILIDEVRYDDGIFWPDDAGKSISLDPRRRGSQFNDDATNWCHGQTAISSTNPDLGTPGAGNDLCP